MKIFVVNCGSSSIKYQLFDMGRESVLAKGVLERIGTSESQLRHEAGARRWVLPAAVGDHASGLKWVLEVLVDAETGVLGGVEEIDGVGHRVVHGGEQMTGSARIDTRALEVIRRNTPLAPLHNPPNLAGIEAAMQAMKNVPHVAVFDTAFLASLPPKAYRYAVPEAWYREHHVRKYGFHGTSHRYVTLQAAGLMGKGIDEVNLITAHLGNGCSMTAVAGGKAVDHSMGMTPLEGLVMGTRSGDIDPAVPLYMQSRGLSSQEVDKALNEGSGLLGLSGRSNDMRDLLTAADSGNERAALAIEVFIYRVLKYVGAYHAILPSLDAVVLTGGIGENSPAIRGAICRRLTSVGIVLDANRNRDIVGGKSGPITADDSPLAVWVIATNEELMIARDTAELVGAEGACAS